MEPKVSSCLIRRANENDLAQIADLFARHNYGVRRLEWLRWKYLDNPDGPARIYIAEDADEGVIGISARLPRRFTSSATGEFSVYQNVDLFMAEKFRGKGIYGRISKYARNERDYFLIGFPNELSHVVEKTDHVIPLEDWIFPLMPSGTGWRKFKALGLLMDFLSKLYAFLWLGPYPDNLQMMQVEKFHADFDVPSDVIHGVRSAAYLNWRFFQNPMRRFAALEFLENSLSIGYCVYAVSGSAAELYDFICTRRRRECIRLLVEHCRSQKLTHLNFRGANLRMGSFGFLRRRSREDCIISDLPDGRPAPKGPWLLTLADRDV